MSLEQQIKDAGQSSSNILMLNDLANGKINIVLQAIAKEIVDAGKLGKSKQDQLTNRQAKIKTMLDNWQDVLNRSSEYPKVKKLVEALLQDINEIAQDPEGKKPIKIDKNKYKIDEEQTTAEVGVNPQGPLETLTQAVAQDAEQQAIDSIKQNKNLDWENFLKNKNISEDLKQSFISRIMNENKKNNMIFLNPVPKKGFFNNKANVDNLIKQLRKVQKNKNFYDDNIEPAQVSLPSQLSATKMKEILKNNGIIIYDLFKTKQGNSELVKKSEIPKIATSIKLNFQEKTVEQILEGADEPEQEQQKKGRKPTFTQLKADPSSIQLPKNKPLSEVILNELGIYESQLKANMFKSQAYDKIKNTPQYQKATPNEKNQLLINAIGGQVQKNRKKYNEEVKKLYAYVGNKMGISKPTKQKVIKKLSSGIAKATAGDLEALSEEVEYMKKRRTEIMAKDKDASAQEIRELDDIMKNLKGFEDEAERGEAILQNIKSGLSLAKQFTQKGVTTYTAPIQRILKEKEEEIEKAQKEGAFSALPEEVTAEPVALPDINKELLSVKTKTAQIEQNKQNKKPYDEAELESLKIQQLNLENQLRGKRKDKPVPVAKESDKIGAYRPYFPNVTEQTVQDAEILASLEQMENSLNNFQVFDIPSDNTGGLGTSKNNFLVKDDVETWNRVNDGTLRDIWSWDNYAQDEQKFWEGRPVIDEITAQRQIKYNNFINNSEMVTEFLEMFNKNNNGFIDEYQPPEETDKFRNIYMEPSNFYKPTPYSNFANVKNQGFLETDFLNNVNFFVNP